MITVAPALAQVASSTRDGIAVLRLQPRIRPEVDPAEDRVEDAGRARVVERLPEEDRDHGRDDDREIGQRAVEAAEPPDLAHQHGGDQRDRDSRRSGRGTAKRSVFLTAVGSSGSLSTVRKLSSPTQVGRLHEVRVLQRHDHRARRSGTTRKPRRRTASAAGRAASSGRRRAPMSTGVRRRRRRLPVGAHRDRLAVRGRSSDRVRPRHTASVARTLGERGARPPVRGNAYLPCADRGLRGAVRLLRAGRGCSAFLSVRTACTTGSSAW